MREYVAVAFNHVLAVDSNTGICKPRVEMIVVGSAPHWIADVSGFHTTRTLEEHRTYIGPRELRELSKVLAEQADILDRMKAGAPDLKFDLSRPSDKPEES